MSLVKTITDEVMYRLRDESVVRIGKCLDQLTDEEIWSRPNKQLVSIGNLILHLNGNVRQYVLFGLGGHTDNRHRQAEFDHTNIINKVELKNMMDELMIDVEKTLESLDETVLSKPLNIQGMNITGFGVLMHVVEHFSYHVGQITWHTKLLKNIDLAYYGDKNLDITG